MLPDQLFLALPFLPLHVGFRHFQDGNLEDCFGQILLDQVLVEAEEAVLREASPYRWNVPGALEEVVVLRCSLYPEKTSLEV